MKHHNYDLIISGGGLAGCLIASFLSTIPLKIAIIEKKSQQQLAHDPRNLALNYTNALLLKHFHLLPNDSLPIEQVHISEKGSFGIVRIKASDYEIPALGYMVSYQKLMTTFLENCAIQKNDFYDENEITQFEKQNEMFHVSLKNNLQLQARLLIAAEGPQSFIRQKLNMPSVIKNYHQKALVTQIEFKNCHQKIAYERFTGTGSLALLPYDEKNYTLVWCESADHIDHLSQLSNDQLQQEIIHFFGERLGKIIHIGQKHIFPLSLQQTEKNIAEQIILLGHTTHAIHPIAAQGFNLTMFDLGILYELIAAAHENGETWCDQKILEEYEKLRHADQKNIIQFTERLMTTFYNPLLPFKLLRNSGLKLLNMIDPLKKHFAYAKMGYRAKLPKIIRALSHEHFTKHL